HVPERDRIEALRRKTRVVEIRFDDLQLIFGPRLGGRQRVWLEAAHAPPGVRAHGGEEGARTPTHLQEAAVRAIPEDNPAAVPKTDQPLEATEWRCLFVQRRPEWQIGGWIEARQLGRRGARREIDEPAPCAFDQGKLAGDAVE